MGRQNRRTPKYFQGLAPTKERQRQNGGVSRETIHEKSGDRVYISHSKANAECTLDHYRDLNKISEIEHRAGIRFAKAHQCAVQRIRTDDASGSHGDVEMAYLMPIHSQRLLDEAYSVLTRIQKGVVIDVCGFGYGVGDTFRLLILRRALVRLVKKWELS